MSEKKATPAETTPEAVAAVKPETAEPKAPPAPAEQPKAEQQPETPKTAEPVSEPKAAEPAIQEPAAATEERTIIEKVATAVAAAKADLSGQIAAALRTLDRSKAEFDEAKSKLRTEVDALGERITGAIGQLKEKDQSAETEIDLVSGDWVQVVLRRPATLAGRQREAGHVIGSVSLAEGVTIDYLVDAVRSRIAGAKVK